MDERPSEPVLVSACLLGRACRYDGRHNHDGVLEEELASRGLHAVPFCPEEHGQLGTPRPAAWICAGPAEHAEVEADEEDRDVDGTAVLDGHAHVRDVHGDDVTDAFLTGAHGALETCLALGVRTAYLKERSPSCGVHQTHVDDELVDGPGVTTALLRRAGIQCIAVEGRRAAPDAP